MASDDDADGKFKCLMLSKGGQNMFDNKILLILLIEWNGFTNWKILAQMAALASRIFWLHFSTQLLE